jgi:hypothetical protein
MNFWKPLALASIAAFVLVAGSGGAQADTTPPIAEKQPNMEEALAHLKAAKASLQRAEHDKGGWRAAAVGATDNAIRETERGINWADKH